MADGASASPTRVTWPSPAAVGTSTSSPGDDALDVAAGFGGQVDDHRAGAHPGDHVGGDQQRCRPAGDRGGGDQHVRCGDVRGQQLALPYRAVVAELAGVAAGALGGLEVEVDEGAAHRGRPRRRRPGGCRWPTPARRAAWRCRSPAGRRRRRRARAPGPAGWCRPRSCRAGRTGGSGSPPRAPRGSRRPGPAS